MFKRRTRRPLSQRLLHLVYPPGGWGRAISYTYHRLRRIPDKPHRIARGVFAGIFVSFTPFFGFHFLLAAGLAWLIGGNLVAALLATFVGNPLTFPVIMTVAVELGNQMLGNEGVIPLAHIVGAFAGASVQLWNNLLAIFTSERTHWDLLERFFFRVFLPYLLGGLLPGIAAGMAGYYLTLPAISAYQKRRRKKRVERRERPAHPATPAAGEPAGGEKPAGTA